MGFVDSIKTCFTKYIDFEGRASRSEFWWWTLFTVLLMTVLYGIYLLLSLSLLWTAIPYIGAIIGTVGVVISWIFLCVAILVNLALVIPSLAVSARRFEDSGKPGWLVCICYLLYPWIIGIILWVVLCCLPSVKEIDKPAVEAA